MVDRTRAAAFAFATLLAHSASCQAWGPASQTQIGGFNIGCIVDDGQGMIAYNSGVSRTWLNGPGGWTSYNAALTSRQWPTCAELGGSVYLFGGYNGAFYLNELWRFQRSNNNWVPVQPSGAAPSPRIYAAGAKLDSRILFFGGRDFAQFFNETWTMEEVGGAATWVQHTSPPGLVERFAHAMSPGPDNTIVMFGGAQNYFGPVLGDCWVFDGATNTWTEHLGTAPPPAPGATMHYDSDREVAVLLHPNDETWEWSGFDWRKVPVTATPSWSSPLMLHDAANGIRAFHVSPNSLTTFFYTPSVAKFELSIPQTCSQTGGQPLELRPFERDLPIIGETMNMVAVGMLPTSLAVGGLEVPTVGPTPFGCGCTIGLSGTNTIGVLLTGAGNTRLWSFSIPNDASLSGLQLDAQAVIVEPTINCWLSTTQRGTLTLGL